MTSEFPATAKCEFKILIMSFLIMSSVDAFIFFVSWFEFFKKLIFSVYS